MDKIFLFGLAFSAANLDSAARAIVSEARAGIRGYVFTANVDHIVLLHDSKPFRDAYAGARHVFADGMPVVWISRFLGKPLPARVAGADLLPAICRLAALDSLGIFFLGGEAGVAAAAAETLTARFPGLNVAGTYSPPRGFENSKTESSRILKMITDSGARILFVGVGAPKQEIWIADHIDSLPPLMALGTGAAFDFAASRLRRASPFLQRIGLEWAVRLAVEPRRMWRRYLLRDARFLPLALREMRVQKGKRF